MPVPLIIHTVAATLTAVATAGAVRLREPVEPEPARISVSEVILSVIGPALSPLMNVIVVPIGNATEALAGIVQARAVVSALGW